jgi:hypothetical protein
VTYILCPATPSTFDPVWVSYVALKPDKGLFYVRWWAQDSVHPVEFKFESRAKAIEQINELYRCAPYVRIEMLEATEWGTRRMCVSRC